MVAHFFTAYGLRLSSNLLPPGVVGLLPVGTADLRIHFGYAPPNLAHRLVPTEPPWYSSTERTPSGESVLLVWKLDSDRFYRFRYADGTEFLLDSDGGELWATWPENMTLEDTATYLLGPILGCLLRLRGVTCLHASAVLIEGRAVALVGPAGSGKSSTAAALAAKGFPVLSDDIVALDQRDSRLWAQPGYPRLNLWPDSVQALYGASDQLPLITPPWPKRFLDVAKPPLAFHPAPAPMGAVYLLEATDEPGLPQVQMSNNRAGLVSLVANTYANYLLDPPLRAREFKLLGEVIASVPVRRLRFAATPQSFGQLPGVILEDLRHLPAFHA